jgi:hypothetical protein
VATWWVDELDRSPLQPTGVVDLFGAVAIGWDKAGRVQAVGAGVDRGGAGGNSQGLVAGRSMRAPAAQLGRAPSTIRREIGRNGGRGAYRATVSNINTDDKHRLLLRGGGAMRMQQ